MCTAAGDAVAGGGRVVAAAAASGQVEGDADVDDDADADADADAGVDADVVVVGVGAAAAEGGIGRRLLSTRTRIGCEWKMCLQCVRTRLGGWRWFKGEVSGVGG